MPTNPDPGSSVTLHALDGVPLHLQAAALNGPARANVVLTHGFGEHSGRYRHVADAFARADIRTWSYDLRGHGRSGGARGDAARYGLLLEDLATVVDRVRSEPAPLFLMGHSLGGQITLSYLSEQRHDADFHGAVITSPWLQLAFQPARWRLALGRLAMLLFPGLTQRTPSEPGDLSRDLEHLAGMPNLELCHRNISARLFFAVVRAGQEALENASRVRTPLLLIHGGADTVTCQKATCAFYDRASAEDKTLRIYPDARHETHNDLCREQVITDIRRWMEDRLPTRDA